MSDLTVINPTPSGAGNIPAQASSDAELVRLWLHGRSPQTQRAYKTDTAAFPDLCGQAATAGYPRRRPSLCGQPRRPAPPPAAPAACRR